MKCCFVAMLMAVLAVSTRAQILGLGYCPEYLPMPGFDVNRFLGVWYESERNLQLSELISRCVMSNYTRGSDGKLHVINEVRSRVTGVKHVLEGEIKKAPSKAEEGKLHVKYSVVPFVSPESQYNVLETDYDNFAVLWSCSNTGPFPANTQNAWIMTRKRPAPIEVLQKAYGVLDKYRISKTFFVKTNQEDCVFDDNEPIEHQPVKESPNEPPKKDSDEEYDDATPVRSAALIAAADEPIVSNHNVDVVPKKSANVQQIDSQQQPAVKTIPEQPLPKSVPEVIMKIADQASVEQQQQVKESQASKDEKVMVAEPVNVEVVAAAKESSAGATIKSEEKQPVADAAIAKEKIGTVVHSEESAIPSVAKKDTEYVEGKIEIVKP